MSILWPIYIAIYYDLLSKFQNSYEHPLLLDFNLSFCVFCCNAGGCIEPSLKQSFPSGFRNKSESPRSLLMILHSHPSALASSNKFVETALAYSLTYVSVYRQSSLHSASVTILADRDYYSSTGPSGGEVLSSEKGFPDFKVPLHEAHKTGLGSSAALVTALVAALLTYYLPTEIISLESEIGKARVHNLAQAAHCAAQGKVGSGFDVAAAVYGSCIYRRFSPFILAGLAEFDTENFSTRLRAVVEDTDQKNSWDMEIHKSLAVIPAGLRLVMCDVDCGSETVGMAKRVLAWRKDNPQDAAHLWKTLQKENEHLAKELQRLAQMPNLSLSKNEDIRSSILRIRSLIREMSTKAGVPIEPNIQTELLDACSQISGVVGGVVPGAGGFDAIALLVEDRKEVLNALSVFLGNYNRDSQHSDATNIGKVKVLGVQQDTQGLKVEGLAIYQGWIL